jgi:hypothetical protein
MEKKMLTLVAVLLLAGLCCSDAFASSPMGPPTTGLEKGQLDLGVDYSYSKLCIDFDFCKGTGPMPDFTKHSFKMDNITGRLGYGITDSWEGYLNLGAARGRASEDMERHSADGIAFGGGTKITFHEDDKLKWGGLFQARWVDMDGDASGPGWTGDLELEIMQLQLAIGPTYELMECLSVYGGPFWYYLDGEKEYEEPGWYEEYDMSNCSDFGGYIGALINLSSNANLNIEFQMTEHDEVLGVNFAWLFK